MVAKPKESHAIQLTLTLLIEIRRCFRTTDTTTSAQIPVNHGKPSREDGIGPEEKINIQDSFLMMALGNRGKIYLSNAQGQNGT